MTRILVLIPQGSRKNKDAIHEMRKVIPEANIVYLNVFVPNYSDKKEVIKAVKEIKRRVLNVITNEDIDRVILYANGSAWHNVIVSALLTKFGIAFDVYTFERQISEPVFTINAKDL